MPVVTYYSIKKERLFMILAGITLFNPNLKRLKENIAAITTQVDSILCVDNGSNNIVKIEHILSLQYPDIIFIKNFKNLGVATALNQMFQYAQFNGYDWVLTLDQDSICPQNLIKEFKEFIGKKRIGCICPLVKDRNYMRIDKHHGKVEKVDKCITSASLNSVDAWKDVKGFTDELFIDFVDHDYCAKLIEHGYKILRINSVILLHEIGKGKDHKLFGLHFTTLNHNAFRKYYIVRNRIYYMYVHKKIINYKKELLKFYILFFKTIFFEDDKFKKIIAMFKGWRDGIIWKSKLKCIRGKR